MEKGCFVSIPAYLAEDYILKPNEKIVARNSIVIYEDEIQCSNATVVKDDRGEISWYDNDSMIAIWIENKNNEKEEMIK